MCFGKAKRRLSRSNGERFPPCFGRWWRCGQSITHRALLCHLRHCSDVLCRSWNHSQLLSSKLEYEIGKVLQFLCSSGVRTMSWYARASVCSLQRGQLHNSSDWLFHLKIMCLAWSEKKKNGNFLPASTTPVSSWPTSKQSTVRHVL